MKKHILFFLAAISCISCSPFYQLYKTSSLDLSVNDGIYSYNTADIDVGYDLWSDGGDGSFVITNKTKVEIFIDLGRSHMVVNDQAASYFLNAEISVKEYSQLSANNINSGVYSYWYAVATASENSVTLKEKRFFSLPPNSYVIVSGYHINQKEFQSCEVKRYPGKKQIKPLEFQRASSPIVVRNYLVYSFTEDFTDFKTVDAEFWVSEITNYPMKEFVKTIKVKDCNNDKEVKAYVLSSPSSFFVKYKKESYSAPTLTEIHTVH